VFSFIIIELVCPTCYDNEYINCLLFADVGCSLSLLKLVLVGRLLADF